ncbi:CueP family metal-binding protein [Corynebacterium sp. A21]|uniref:CueP family metal-binding protein n=1 Tax=Corynebacterium sp. A21 TaxID=3457318 RepID=UPI003FD274D1
MKIRVAAAAALTTSLLILTGCAAGQLPEQPLENSAAEFENRDAREVIAELDTTPVAERRSDIMASIHPDALIITDAAGQETSLPMPADEFYVSVAPYATQTHDCFYHSLTTCLGELGNQPIQVKVVAEDGTTLIDEQMQTFDNGFLGLWLPRDIAATLTIEHEGRTAIREITTDAEAATCLTTLQLV